MTVHFIGAGPGAADLITVRGRDLLARCPVCLYAGSIVPPELLALCPPGARIVDTAPMTLDEIEAEYVRAHAAGEDVARLHSGDLSIYSALAEQLRRLERHGIPYTLTPGVPAFAAAAAALGSELTVPEVAQSVVLTRMPGRASAMPKTEQLAAFAATGATLAIHLAIPAIETIVRELTPFYGADCPAAVVVRASWPEERILRGTLGDIAGKVAAAPIERTALVLVGRALAAKEFRDSALYDPDYRRRFRMERARDPRRREHGRPAVPSRSNTATSTAMPLSATGPSAVARAAAATASPSATPAAVAWAKASAAVFDAVIFAHSALVPPAASASAGERGEIDRAALGMQVEHALRELGHLGDAAGDGDPRAPDGGADI